MIMYVSIQLNIMEKNQQFRRLSKSKIIHSTRQPCSSEDISICKKEYQVKKKSEHLIS